MSKDLSLDEIRGLLLELGSRLKADTRNVSIRLVGGAAIAFIGNSRRVTQDVDAVYDVAPKVDRIVQDLAAERELPSDWLNQSAKAFIPAGAS